LTLLSVEGATLSDPCCAPVTISLLSPGGESRWNEYVDKHPLASSAHLVQWKNLIERVFGKSCYFLQAMTAEALVGVLPLVHMKSLLFGNYMVSVPYLNYGGLLADSPEIAQQLQQAAAELAVKLGAHSVEFREKAARHGEQPCRTDKVAMMLDLPATEAELSRQLGSKLRSQIKRPQRENPDVKIGREELLEEFYEVFCRNMRDLGTPVYSRRLFSAILQDFPSAYIVVVFLQGRPVSAAFLLGYRGMLEIPWASTVSDVNHLSMNMLLYWEVLRSAVSRGYHRFDFGRSTVDAGTYRFKRQWGAQPIQLYWYYWLDAGHEMPNLKPDNPRYKKIIELWKKLPLPITNLLGPAIVRHLP